MHNLPGKVRLGGRLFLPSLGTLAPGLWPRAESGVPAKHCKTGKNLRTQTQVVWLRDRVTMAPSDSQGWRDPVFWKVPPCDTGFWNSLAGRSFLIQAPGPGQATPGLSVSCGGVGWTQAHIELLSSTTKIF